MSFELRLTFFFDHPVNFQSERVLPIGVPFVNRLFAKLFQKFS